tara:strand:+ start:145 stop:399 length:255 start_codon:yes stop_codon:yes gene_type:complete
MMTASQELLLHQALADYCDDHPGDEWEDLRAELQETWTELRRERRLAALNAEALAEIKATVDGDSDQPVKDIIYGLLKEIEALT